MAALIAAAALMAALTAVALMVPLGAAALMAVLTVVVTALTAVATWGLRLHIGP